MFGKEFMEMNNFYLYFILFKLINLKKKITHKLK